MNQIVKADIKHQKHQARMTRHCKYVKNKDIMAPISTENLKIKSQNINGSTPITKKAPINEAII